MISLAIRERTFWGGRGVYITFVEIFTGNIEIERWLIWGHRGHWPGLLVC